MTLTLVATVGGTTSNAYLDQTACGLILDGVPNASAWTSADATAGGARDQALVYATTLLNVLAYRGIKYSASQALQWPRGGVLDPDYGDASGAIAGYMVGGSYGVYLDFTLIPARVKRATAQLALAILRAGTADVWGVDSTANIAAKSIDVISTTFIDPARRRYGLQVYPAIWREIFPLTLASEAGTVSRA